MRIEEIILKHSHRGMDILRKRLPDDFCFSAAKKIFELKRKNILLATGFYVAGYAETDGPVGTFYLAKALQKLGFSPIIVTDRFCKDFFSNDTIPVLCLAHHFDCEKLLERYAPVAMIAIERCGENINGDYANSRGMSIAAFTPAIDRLFDMALRKGIYTVGIGDGGNEIGMGNLQDVISEKFSIVPCKTKTTDLIVATVSNWGAYGIIACLSVLAGQNLFASYEEIDSYIEYIISKGSIDGIKKVHTPTVDGYAKKIEKEIIDSINDYIENINREK